MDGYKEEMQSLYNEFYLLKYGNKNPDKNGMFNDFVIKAQLISLINTVILAEPKDKQYWFNAQEYVNNSGVINFRLLDYILDGEPYRY